MKFSGLPKNAMSPGTPPANPIPALRASELIRWLLGRRRRFRVAGDSMRPTLLPGDIVLIALLPSGDGVSRLPNTGDVLLCKHPYQRGAHILKRLEHITADGRFFMVGDNPSESTDSRAFGALDRDRVIGRVSAVLRRGPQPA